MHQRQRLNPLLDDVHGLVHQISQNQFTTLFEREHQPSRWATGRSEGTIQVRGIIMKATLGRTDLWTHPSVVQMAQEGDPIKVIADRARNLIFKASELGCAGPPFDAFQLAALAGLNVVARSDISDARTIPSSTSGSFVIEFNPNRPKHRIRYSICHEIAHTLFRDCGNRVRHRLTHADMTGDDWQLESLCNIAAAELLMPIGSFPELESNRFNIDAVLDLRKRFDVSVEAVLLRSVHLAKDRVLSFVASPTESGPETRYRIEYAIPSRNLKATTIGPGFILSRKSVVNACTAIGHTAKAEEVWFGLGPVRVECVGLPPYPTQVMPRVAGVLLPVGEASIAHNKITYLKGDATEPHGCGGPKVIAQIVNDQALTWGAGFAVAMRKRWPASQESFRLWASNRRNLALGNIHTTCLTPDLWLASMVAQHGYGPSPQPRIRYAALERSLCSLREFASSRAATIHVPRLGSGQAGGYWSIVSEIIDETLCAFDMKVYVYDLPSGSPTQPKQSSIFDELFNERG